MRLTHTHKTFTALMAILALAFFGKAMAITPKDVYGVEDVKEMLVETGNMGEDIGFKLVSETPTAIRFKLVDESENGLFGWEDNGERNYLINRQTLMTIDENLKRPKSWYNKVPFEVKNLSGLRLASAIHMSIHAVNLFNKDVILFDDQSLGYEDLEKLVENGKMIWKEGAYRFKTGSDSQGVSMDMFPEVGAIVTRRDGKMIYRHLISQFWWFGDSGK